MIKFYKLLFFNFMVLGTLIAVSSYSWLSMWMGLEINLLSVIPLFSSTKNLLTAESSLKYFITQALASMTLLFSVIMMLLMNEFIMPQVNSFLLMLLNSALLTKLGAAPFHFWFPEVMEGLNWTNSLILLTWQKIAPMILIMNNSPSMKFLSMIIFMSLIVSTISSFNQTSLRKIMAFSSINHIAWMIMAMNSFSVWSLYFLVYTIISLNIVSIFMYTKSSHIAQLAISMNSTKMFKTIVMMNFLSLGGLPPFLGFLPKWFVINWAIDSNQFLMTFILIIFTLIMLFIYIKISFSAFIFNMMEFKNINPNFKNFYLISFSFISTNSLILCTMIFSLL
uniref:NADH-ubiquinone oxidoreductase chain 2 n=1 Tax=Macratriinae sp. 2 ACP-2013 TaxID=1434623 RepID=A0A3G3ME96_9CUCU|nr:NADH dehydrogenase subunit 2 [Macratriinae sp. 2 ACP-2013]